MFKSLHIQPLHTCNTATTATKMHSIGGVGAPRMVSTHHAPRAAYIYYSAYTHNPACLQAPCGSGARKSPLLPHANSSSSHTTHSLFPPARYAQQPLVPRLWLFTDGMNNTMWITRQQRVRACRAHHQTPRQQQQQHDGVTRERSLCTYAASTCAFTMHTS